MQIEKPVPLTRRVEEGSTEAGGTRHLVPGARAQPATVGGGAARRGHPAPGGRPARWGRPRPARRRRCAARAKAPRDVLPFGEGMSRRRRSSRAPPSLHPGGHRRAGGRGDASAKCVITTGVGGAVPGGQAGALHGGVGGRFACSGVLPARQLQGNPVSVGYVFSVRLVLPRKPGVFHTAERSARAAYAATPGGLPPVCRDPVSALIDLSFLTRCVAPRP